MAMKIEVRLKKLTDNAIVPQYGTEQAAGFDLCADTGNVPVILPPAQVIVEKKGFLGFGRKVTLQASHVLVKTGVAVALPEGFELQVRSRSGLALKQGIQVHVGTIDADYRGEIGVIMFNFGEEPFVINTGDRIAQGVLNRVEQAGFSVVDTLDETERGEGGFGSTGVSAVAVATARALEVANTISASRITSDTINPSQIAASAITANKLADLATLTGGKGNPISVPTLPTSEPIINTAQPVESPETHNVGIIINDGGQA